MGKIISSKVVQNEKIIVRLLVGKEEFLDLRNNFKNVFLFAEELCADNAVIITRGGEGVTKYFNIPFNLRIRKKKSYDSIVYQKLESNTKVFYVYSIDKKKDLI